MAIKLGVLTGQSTLRWITQDVFFLIITGTQQPITTPVSEQELAATCCQVCPFTWAGTAVATGAPVEYLHVLQARQ